MTDFIGEIRKEQHLVSKDITDVLYNELYTNQPLEEGVDKEDAEILRKSNLLENVLSAVIFYTDWLIFGRLLPETGWHGQELPADCEIDYDIICEKSNVDVEIVTKTVELLHQEPSIPLVGMVDKGNLYPNVRPIARYISMYEEPKIVKNYLDIVLLTDN